MKKVRNPDPPDPSNRPDPPPPPPATLASAVDIWNTINGLQEACERYRGVIERLEGARRDAGSRIELLDAEVAKLSRVRSLMLRRPELTDRVLLDQLTAVLE